jgi:hypothetical protein
MKLKLTRERIFAIWYVLSNLKLPENEKIDKRFDFAKNRTLENIAPEIAEIIKARKSGIPRFDEFTTKRNEILSNLAIKDSNGNPNIINNQYNIDPDKKQEAAKAIQSLTSLYQDAIDERQKEVNIYNELITEEIEADITQVSFIALPSIVSDEFTKVIRPMIKETDEQLEALL